MRAVILQKLLVAVLRRHLAGGRSPVPEVGYFLWSCFCQLSAARTYQMSGPNPISYAEIEAWARLHRWPLRPDHIAAIRALDDVYLEHAYATAGKKEAGFSAPTDAPVINPAAFDAVFG